MIILPINIGWGNLQNTYLVTGHLQAQRKNIFAEVEISIMKKNNNSNLLTLLHMASHEHHLILSGILIQSKVSNHATESLDISLSCFFFCKRNVNKCSKGLNKEKIIPVIWLTQAINQTVFLNDISKCSQRLHLFNKQNIVKY